MARVELPDDATIKRWKLVEGISYREMVERWYEESNQLATREAFAMRCSRRGWTQPQGQNPLIPWVLEERHKSHHYAQMLRYEWLRREGAEDIPEAKLSNMAFFFSQRVQKETVIHYEPNSEKGFWDVPREKGDRDVVRDPEYHAELMRKADRKAQRAKAERVLGTGPVD